MISSENLVMAYRNNSNKRVVSDNSIHVYYMSDNNSSEGSDSSLSKKVKNKKIKNKKSKQLKD